MTGFDGGVRDRGATLRRDDWLRKADEFRRVFREGRSVANKLAVVYTLRVPGERRKIGVTVPRKMGGAVVRNRVRRRIREVLRLHAGRIGDEWHLVVLPRQPSREAAYRDLESGLLSLIERAGVTRPVPVDSGGP